MGRLGPQAKEGVVPAPAGLPASALLGLRSPGRGQAYRVIPNGNYDPLPINKERSPSHDSLSHSPRSCQSPGTSPRPRLPPRGTHLLTCEARSGMP